MRAAASRRMRPPTTPSSIPPLMVRGASSAGWTIVGVVVEVADGVLNGDWALTEVGALIIVRSESSSAPASAGSATTWVPDSSSTTSGVLGKRCSCSMACRPRANSSALWGRASGFLAMPWASRRSNESGTSARPVGGTGVARIRGMRA